MTAITAELVGNLRDATDEPMMRCKAALVACGGDFAAAQRWLRAPTPAWSLEARVLRLEKIVAQLCPDRSDDL